MTDTASNLCSFLIEQSLQPINPSALPTQIDGLPHYDFPVAQGATTEGGSVTSTPAIQRNSPKPTPPHASRHPINPLRPMPRREQNHRIPLQALGVFNAQALHHNLWQPPTSSPQIHLFPQFPTIQVFHIFSLTGQRTLSPKNHAIRTR